MKKKKKSQERNIARGTTDPEIDSVTWTKFSDHTKCLNSQILG